MATEGVDSEHHEARLATDISIWAGKRQGVFEHRYGIGKVDAVLAQVGAGLCRILT